MVNVKAHLQRILSWNTTDEAIQRNAGDSYHQIAGSPCNIEDAVIWNYATFAAFSP